MDKLVENLVTLLKEKDVFGIMKWLSVLLCLIAPAYSVIFVFFNELFVKLDFAKLLLLVVSINGLLYIGICGIVILKSFMNLSELKYNLERIKNELEACKNNGDQIIKGEIGELKNLEDLEIAKKINDEKIATLDGERDKVDKKYTTLKESYFFLPIYLIIMVTCIFWIVLAANFNSKSKIEFTNILSMALGMICWLLFSIIFDYLKSSKEIKKFPTSKMVLYIAILGLAIFGFVFYNLASKI